MPDSPPPYGPKSFQRTPQRSTLDAIAIDAAAAARRATRIEQAVADLSELLVQRAGSLPPRLQPKADRSWADDSVRIEVASSALERAFEDREVRSFRERKAWVLEVVKLAAGGTGSILLWEVVKWLMRLSHP